MACEVNITLINLKKAKASSVELNRRKTEICLITEPYVLKGNVKILDRAHGELYYAIGKSPRACVRVNKNLNPWIVVEFTTKDICTVAVQIGGKTAYVCAAYLDINLPAVDPLLERLALKCDHEDIPLVIGADTNAHSGMWGSSVPNGRGDDLEEFISNRNLIVANVGCVPTFKSHLGESIIDVVLLNQAANNCLDMRDWRVEETETFSDHRYVSFKVGKYKPEKREYRNLKKANWDVFKDELRKAEFSTVSEDGSNLDICAEQFQDVVAAALNVACPTKSACSLRPNPWWTRELEELRRRVKEPKASKKADYRPLVNQYKQCIKLAKNKSWESFCSKAESAKDVSSIIKMLSTKSLRGIGILKRDGKYVSTPADSLNTLMDVHFPDSVADVGEEEVTLEGVNKADDVVEYITPDKVKAALDSFGPRKAAGPDLLPPVVLQKLGDEEIKHLTMMYKKIS